MILQSFTVTSSAKEWVFVDSDSIDSDDVRAQIRQLMADQLALMQEDAMCAALGIDEAGPIGNFCFGVYDSGTLVGAFLVAALDYQSGPWADLVDWEIVSSDPAVFWARPMPSFLDLDAGEALALAVDAAHYLLANTLTSADGCDVQFSRLSWAIFKERTDENSLAALAIHNAAAADERLDMTETPDPEDETLTHADIELA